MEFDQRKETGVDSGPAVFIKTNGADRSKVQKEQDEDSLTEEAEGMTKRRVVEMIASTAQATRVLHVATSYLWVLHELR